MQHLCKTQKNLYEGLNESDQNAWTNFQSKYSSIYNISLLRQRNILPIEHDELEMHGFSDESESEYGA